jgi:hypothetical protein
VTGELIVGLVIGFLVFWVGWSWLFYRLKRHLLRRAGFDERRLEMVFSNRLAGFDLESLLAPHSERKIRIADMVARRGRTFAAVFMGFYFMYKGLGEKPTAESMAFGLESNLLEGLVFAWWGVITFYSNGILGRIHYGAQARVMDGVLGRANALCIGTLWHAFKFAMIPLGLALAKVYPPTSYAAVFGLIWFSYLSCDFASEIFGALFGKQTIAVWGLGDVAAPEGFVDGMDDLEMVLWAHVGSFNGVIRPAPRASSSGGARRSWSASPRACLRASRGVAGCRLAPFLRSPREAARPAR